MKTSATQSNDFWSLDDPPITLDQTTEDKTQRKLRAEKDGKTIYDFDPNLLATAFNGVELEFNDDLDEARRYQARFPDAPLSALIGAWKPRK